MENGAGDSELQTMLEIGCRKCFTRIKVPPNDGIYKCKCQTVSVRVNGPITLINEMSPNASALLKEKGTTS